ncbi:unnamed protein product [Rotaria magnacalcarata]|uniref:Uncharacterized protein n=2 Tax=Rotaria magnacalcarata TaxID=392030 RepID=A0A817A3Z6_9BILA|nr:unnamed protein product [Rotaria magnacalcarata]CAF3751352.1 unnamed protein product [Rotaria magnacalcarata]CAF3925385.1 unnamed protein product [Rotaria magnacalcarata]
MYICSDPLDPVRCTGPNQQWCVQLPACYPTIRSCVPTVVERNDYHGRNILDSPLYANSRLIQRLRQNIDQNPVPSSSNEANQMYQQHVIDTDRSNVLPTPISQMPKSRSPSLLQQFFNRKSMDDNRTIEKSRNITPILNVHDSSKSNEKDLENANSRNKKKLRQAIHNVMKSTSAQDNLSTNISTHHLDPNLSNSVTDIKNSHFLSPSNVQQQIDKKSSQKQSTSTIQSPTNSTSDTKQKRLRAHSSASISQYSNRVPNMSREKLGTGNNWIKKLQKKQSSKQLNTKSSKNKINVDHLHMGEAMAALEPHITREALQALINKKKDLERNVFMRLLTGPSRCCRSYRTQRRLATVAQHSIDIAIRDVSMSPIHNNNNNNNQTSSQIKRLASHCYINDYPVWLERQQELMMWFSLAKLLKLPIEENKVIQEELEQIRLQHECLRFIERLTLSVGPG